MLSRALLADAIKVCCMSTESVGVPVIQRRVRVGLATALQLEQALQDAGVLGPRVDGTRRPVVEPDPGRATALVIAAIDDGRIRLDSDAGELVAPSAEGCVCPTGDPSEGEVCSGGTIIGPCPHVGYCPDAEDGLETIAYCECVCHAGQGTENDHG